jgi:MrcB-like, N-terminal domain
LTKVCLSLNQGVTAATEQAKVEGIPATTLLRREAAAIRRAFDGEIDDLEADISLGTSTLVRKYETGNIAGLTWELGALPPETELDEALQRFLDLYVEAVAIRDRLRQLGAGGLTLPARATTGNDNNRERRFEPKNAAEYLAHIGAQEQVRSRSHEALVDRLGKWARHRGFEPNTNVHPRDLMLHHDHGALLVEVKVFPAGRPRRAVRECIGQLFEYQRFLGPPAATLVAALSEDPGEVFVDLLTSLDIAVVWPRRNIWVGSAKAAEVGLADRDGFG